MKTFAPGLLLLAAVSLGGLCHAAPTAAQTDDVREAVVRDEIAASGTKPRTPCFLSFGRVGTQESDPPLAFLARFAHDPIRLQKGSLRPLNSRRHTA